MTTHAIPTTPPPVNPLDTPKKVSIGQLIEIDAPEMKLFHGVRIQLDLNRIGEIIYPMEEENEPTVIAHAECRMCHWTAESIDDDLSAIQFRAWSHEQDYPGHLVSYRAGVYR